MQFKSQRITRYKRDNTNLSRDDLILDCLDVNWDSELELDKMMSAFPYKYWTPGLPVGVHSNRPCPSVRPSVRLSVFKYLGNRSLVFLKLCMKLGGNKVKKVTWPEF